MSKIKIAYIIDQLGTGGTERQLKYLIEGLDRSRFNVSLFLLRGDEVHPFKPKKTNIYILNVRSLISIDGLWKLFRFSRLLKEEKYQIIQTFFQDATIFGFLAARLAGVQIVLVSVRDMGFWATPISLRIHRIITSISDAIVVNSNAVKEHIERHVNKKPIYVIYNGIPMRTEYYRNAKAKKSLATELGIDESLPIVVLVSNCNRKVKRVDLLMDCIPLILKKAKAFFLVVGDGYLRPKLEKKAQELKVQKYVRFVGQRHNVERILAGADIALNTSESEGFSNSILEAMRAGLPVVASDVAGNRELVEEVNTGILFYPGDAIDLAKKIIKILNNESQTERIGSESQEKISTLFSINKMLKEHTKLYFSLIGRYQDQ